MKYTSARSLVAGLGFTLLAAGALAQSSAGQSAQPLATQPSTTQTAPAAPMPGVGASPGTGPNPEMRAQMQQGAGPQGGMRHPQQTPGKSAGEGPMGQIPQAVIDQLALTTGQKAQFDSAQAARKEMHASKQKAMTEQFAKEVIDPRAILAQHKQMRSAMETKMDAVQQKWLTFWDGLSATQKTTLSNYLKSKHAAHTQKKPVVAKG